MDSLKLQTVDILRLAELVAAGAYNLEESHHSMEFLLELRSEAKRLYGIYHGRRPNLEALMRQTDRAIKRRAWKLKIISFAERDAAVRNLRYELKRRLAKQPRERLVGSERVTNYKSPRGKPSWATARKRRG